MNKLVAVKSAWLSRINWTQAIGMGVSLLTYFGIIVPADMADNATAAILGVQALVALVTWILKTFFTATITPSAAAKT